MTTFYICRHGQSENNKRGRLSGWIDTPLTEEGIRNAASSAAKLSSAKIDKIVSSDLGRAFVTAYIISRKLNYPSEIELNKGLREINYGKLGNMPYAAYPEVSVTENTNFVAPGGESLAQMQQRVLDCIRTISLDNPDKTVLLVAHDGTINAVFASFTKQDIGLVDSTSDNAHDFVAKFMYENTQIVAFSEIV